MVEKRADELVAGDVLSIKGDRWAVVKVKVRGKRVKLTIDGRRGSFTDEVKARTVYVIAEPVPLLDASGAQTRWAEISETDLEVPFGDGGQSWDVLSKTERRLVDRLGARLVGVEVDGGKLVVPPVSDSTVLGHLATMHGVRYDGVSLADARLAKHSPGVIADVIQTLNLPAAYALHERLHENFAELVRPHWHRDKAPVS